ncbi:MAG: AAA family ATPase [Nitrososphaerales archaeon]
MKIAVVGKGGVGKTTIAANLARLFAKDGYLVLAIDADPAMNLAHSLGIDKSISSKIIPLADNNDLIEERTGARPGSIGSVFSLTPKVHDIAEKYSVMGPDNVRLLVMGTVKSAGSGCMCPANSLLRALFRHLLIESKDVIVVDMEAGLEHLGRGIVRGFDFILNVVEPSIQSVDTTVRIVKLAKDLNVKNIIIVGNKVRNEKQKGFLEEELKKNDLKLTSLIPYDEKVLEADMLNIPLIDYAPISNSINAIHSLKDLLKIMANKTFSQ